MKFENNKRYCEISGVELPQPEGTPKTLRDVILMAERDGGKADDYEVRFRDFLAQKFGVALAQTDLTDFTSEQMLDNLWFAITGRRIGQ